jgi:tRNA pseudouridine38-40 synthase
LAQFLNGHHDFSAFRAQGCQSKTPYRQLYFIEVQAQAEQIVIDICANAFLHHMVRNIVGSLMAVGEGKQPANWIQQVLLSKDRTQAGITAPPQGLYLAGIYYPEKYQLTSAPIFQRLPKTISRFD